MKCDDKKKETTAAKYANGQSVDITNPAVRCPVVLLLDTSKSMAGQPISELEEALCQFIAEVQDDVAAAASVELCIITLDEKGTIQLPFTAAMDLVPRKLGLKAAGGTFTGKALERAADVICNRRTEFAQNGISSYAPWVILMSDGKPGDNWEPAAQKLLAMTDKLRMQYIGIAIGDNASTKIMQKMLPAQPGPLKLSHVRFKEFFRWLSDSLSAVSCSCVSEQNIPQIKKWSDVF